MAARIFYSLPHDIVYLNIKPTTLKLALLLCTYKECYMDMNTLSEHCHLSVKTIKLAIRELKATNLFTIKSGAKARVSNRYTLNPVDVWKHKDPKTKKFVQYKQPIIRRKTPINKKMLLSIYNDFYTKGKLDECIQELKKHYIEDHFKIEERIKVIPKIKDDKQFLSLLNKYLYVNLRDGDKGR